MTTILPSDYSKFRRQLEFLFNEINLLPILTQYYDDVGIVGNGLSYAPTINNVSLDWFPMVIKANQELIIGGYYLRCIETLSHKEGNRYLLCQVLGVRIILLILFFMVLIMVNLLKL